MDTRCVESISGKVRQHLSEEARKGCVRNSTWHEDFFYKQVTWTRFEHGTVVESMADGRLHARLSATFTRLQNSVRKVVHGLHTLCLGCRAPSQTTHRSRQRARGAMTKRCVENAKLRRVRANHSLVYDLAHSSFADGTNHAARFVVVGIFKCARRYLGLCIQC